MELDTNLFNFRAHKYQASEQQWDVSGMMKLLNELHLEDRKRILETNIVFIYFVSFHSQVNFE
jgi:hypothetical protein